MTAATVAAPSAAAAEIAEAIGDAACAREPVRVAGAGLWLDAGAPVHASRTIAVAAHSGITEYVPGDLVLTALAGTTLREIADATAANGQWLPLDPFGSLDGTLGATVATASSGPLAHANGGPRDLVLGIECVAGTGKIIRGGGRVTKNVAGFDLTRLLVGSWGTLGVITEISVRLRARPAAELTLALPVPADVDRLRERLQWVRSAPLDALAMELLDARLAAALGLGDTTTLLVRIGGNGDSVAAQRTTLARAGGATEIGGSVWEALRTVEPGNAWVWRMSDLPSRVADTWAHAQAMTRDFASAFIHASVGRGIVRCIGVPNGSLLPPTSFGGTTVYEKLPADRWHALAPVLATDPVSRRIRAAFDPHGILNSGILGATTE